MLFVEQEVIFADDVYFNICISLCKISVLKDSSSYQNHTRPRASEIWVLAAWLYTMESQAAFFLDFGWLGSLSTRTHRQVVASHIL